MITTAIRQPRIYYGWWIVSTSVVAATAYAFGSLSLPVFYPELVKAFGWSRASVAAGGSIRLFLVGVMAPINGAFIDRFGAKTVLTAGALGTGLALALLSSADSISQYYLFCLLLGLCLSGIHHLPNHLLVANWFVKNRGLAISLVTTAVGVGGAVIPLLATYLITTLEWRGAFLALAFFLALPLLMILFLVKEKPEEAVLEAAEAVAVGKGSPGVADPPHSAPALRIPDILKNPAFGILSFALMLMAAAMFGTREHLVLYLRDLQFSPAASAATFSLILACSIAGRFLSGLLSDRFSARTVIVLNFLLGGFSLVMLLFASGFLLRYLFPIVFGVSYGAIINLKPLVIFEYFGGRKVGKVYGLVLGCYVFGSSVGPLLTGHIFDRTHSYELAFIVNVILAGMATIAIMLFAHRARPSRRENYRGR